MRLRILKWKSPKQKFLDTKLEGSVLLYSRPVLSQVKGYLCINWGETSKKNYVDGNTTGAVKWIDEEVEAFSGILSTREDYCTWIDARGMASVL